MTALGCPEGGLAVVIGAAGGLGGALLRRLESIPGFAAVQGLTRHSDPPLELTEEASIAAAAARMAERGLPLRLLLIATGFLHDRRFTPEKSARELDPAHLAQSFAINAVGPALVLKHFTPLLPRQGKSVVAALSARVGSIGDNRLGGWHSYRAAKAALNQIIRCAAIEMRRRQPDAVCVALHPGTVASRLSAPFAKSGLALQSPDQAADALLGVIASLTPSDSGLFFDHRGEKIIW